MAADRKPVVRSVQRAASVDEALKILREDNLVLIRDFIEQGTVNRINAELDGPLKKITPGSPYSDEQVREFYGYATRRLSDVASLSKTFREQVLDDDYLHEACTKTFADSGSYWLNLAQLMDIGPGNNPQPLHRDQWGWPIFSKAGQKCPEVIVNFFVGLGKCTEANGATRVIPGSHRWPDMTGGASPDETVAAEMDAGDCVLFSGKLLHGGGSNATRDSHRKALLHQRHHRLRRP